MRGTAHAEYVRTASRRDDRADGEVTGAGDVSGSGDCVRSGEDEGSGDGDGRREAGKLAGEAMAATVGTNTNPTVHLRGAMKLRSSDSAVRPRWPARRLPFLERDVTTACRMSLRVSK